MFDDKKIYASDSQDCTLAEDAVFSGWQPIGGGKVIPLYTVNVSSHISCGSNVSEQTLTALSFQIIETPSL